MLCPSVTGTHSKAYSIKKSIFILIFAFGTERIKKWENKQHEKSTKKISNMKREKKSTKKKQHNKKIQKKFGQIN